MKAYCRGEGLPPPETMLSELLRMREEAQRLLAFALRDIDRRMEEQGRKLDGM